jgi:CRISPR-associated protein Cas2
MVLITYDVSTETDAGKHRLNKVAKQCKNYGQRVQDSVFECVVNPAQLAELKNKLSKIIDIEVDSIRYYYLGDEWHNRVEHIGVKHGIDLDKPIII